MVQNILGEGIDLHLLGLREIAKELGEPVPELFNDETFRQANYFALSTSQVRKIVADFIHLADYKQSDLMTPHPVHDMT